MDGHDVKACVFGLEGTLFKKSYELLGGRHFLSAWGALCASLSPEAGQEDLENGKRFRSGGYQGYSLWVADTILLHQKYGLDRKHFDAVINSVEYHSGVAETISTLQAAGITIAVVSGGLKALADRVALDHGVCHCFAAAEYFWNSDDSLRHWNILPTDFAHKRSAVEMLLKDIGINREQCAFVGDGKNDIDVAGYVGRSVAFNPHQELKDCCEFVVEQEPGKEDLRAILPYLLNSRLEMEGRHEA